jgi:hypothetical protein
MSAAVVVGVVSTPIERRHGALAGWHGRPGVGGPHRATEADRGRSGVPGVGGGRHGQRHRGREHEVTIR